MRMLRRLTAALIVGYLMFIGAIYAMMRRPPEKFASAIAKLPGPLFMMVPFETLWSAARRGTLHPGDLAPDFRLTTLDHKSEVSLAGFRGNQPVVLIYGSYT